MSNVESRLKDEIDRVLALPEVPEEDAAPLRYVRSQLGVEAAEKRARNDVDGDGTTPHLYEAANARLRKYPA